MEQWILQWILLAHVLGAATWFGAHVYVEGMMASATRTKDPETIMTVGLTVVKTNQRVLVGAGLVTLIFGIWLVVESVYDFGMIFVDVGLIATTIVLALSLLIVGPKGKEMAKLVAEHGLTDPEAQGKMRHIGKLSRVMTLLVAVAMILMVLKPGA